MENLPVIVHFSGALIEEGLPELVCGTVIDCRDLEGTSCYCDPAAEQELARRFVSCPVRTVHWIDSGDYHYASALWMDRMDRPFNLVVADHHPDMQEPAFGDILSCGGWVRKVLGRNPNLREVWLVGIDPGLRGECSGFGDRVHVVDREEAASCPPQEVASRIPTDLPVYLSLDKDVLQPDDARTDWDQGTMSLDWLLAFCAGLGPYLAGVDICGALPSAKGGKDVDFSVNRATNRRFHDFFSLYL